VSEGAWTTALPSIPAGVPATVLMRRPDISAAQRATSLSDTRYRNGYVSQLDLLDARRSELRNRRQALQVKSAQYQAAVGLIRALGGGWEVPAGGPAVESASVPVAQAALR
jgi:multidrug efflux system outer membrane protein